MARIRRMRRPGVVLLAALGLAAWSTDAFAQAPSPAAPQSNVQATGGSIVEGKIARVGGARVILANGTEVTLPADILTSQRDGLKPGATIMVSFEERGGQKVVTGIAVESAR